MHPASSLFYIEKYWFFLPVVGDIDAARAKGEKILAELEKA